MLSKPLTFGFTFCACQASVLPVSFLIQLHIAIVYVSMTSGIMVGISMLCRDYTSGGEEATELYSCTA